MMAGLAVALGVLAVILAVPTPRWLSRARWTRRAPMRALLLWQAIAWIGGLATIGVPAAIGEAVASPRGTVIGAVVAAAIAAYLGVHVILTVVAREKRRRRHLTLVDLLGEPLAGQHDVRLIDSPESIAYCIPRPFGASIVVSRGLVDRLPPAELDAVIAHERAHAAQRHDVLLLAFDAWRSALPWLAAARLASRQVARLVELAADDRARRKVGPPELARAIAHAAPAPGALELERLTRLGTPA